MRLYFSVIDCTLMELDARFGERCNSSYQVPTIMVSLMSKQMKPLLELIPDPVDENDLCHEVKVARHLTLSKRTATHNIFQQLHCYSAESCGYVQRSIPSAVQGSRMYTNLGASTAVRETSFVMLSRALEVGLTDEFLSLYVVTPSLQASTPKWPVSGCNANFVAGASRRGDARAI